VGLITDWFWRLDERAGGGARPDARRRFSAAHPVRLGLIAGAATGGLFGVATLIAGATGWASAFTLPVWLFCLSVAVFAGAGMTGIGFLERRRQRRYGWFTP
jgi:hypothetical protein